MKLAEAFGNILPDDAGALLDGGVLKIYSVARPASPNAPVTRSGLLATFQFGSPAVDASAPAGVAFVANTLSSEGVGTPGFARAYSTDRTDIALSEVSPTPGYPISVIRFRL